MKKNLYPKLKPTSIRKYKLKETKPLSNRIILNNVFDDTKSSKSIDFKAILQIVHPQKYSLKKIIKLSFNKTMMNNKLCKN